MGESTFFRGVVGIRQVNVGDFIGVDTPVVSLVATEPIFAEFTVPESVATKIRVSDRVSVRSTVNQDKMFQGEITSINPSFDTDTRSLTVRAKVNNSDQQLVPGSSIDVRVRLSQKEHLIRVNSNALIVSPDGNFVYVIREKNKAIRVPVVVSKRGDRFVLLAKGVSEGDLIVVQGKTKLKPGSTVIVSQ